MRDNIDKALSRDANITDLQDKSGESLTVRGCSGGDSGW